MKLRNIPCKLTSKTPPRINENKGSLRIPGAERILLWLGIEDDGAQEEYLDQ